MNRAGAVLCIASASAFATMGIFGKLAYEQGAEPGTVLAGRFLIASTILWIYVVATGRAGEILATPRRDLVLAFVLGAVGYAAQAGSYFIALDRIGASTLTLLLYTFPALVALGAIALRREPARVQTFAGVVLSFAGIVLVASGGAAASDGVGVAFGIANAVIYATYILSSEGVAGRLSALTLTTVVCTGAAMTTTIGAFATGAAGPGALSSLGWLWIVAIAVIPTVAAISLFFAGMALVGPTATALLSTAEPLVAVTLAWLVLGEPLGVLTIAGGALVVVALIVIRAQPGPPGSGRRDQLVAQETAPP